MSRSSGVLLLATLMIGGCSANTSKPLKAPAGTSTSVPEPNTDEAPAVEPAESARAEESTRISESPAATSEPDSQPVQPEAPAPIPEPQPPPAQPEEPQDDSVVMIDTGARDVTTRPQTLAEAAQAERERRQIEAPTELVITDKTLSKYAIGELTMATGTAAEPRTDPELSKRQAKMAEMEAYWRGGAREIRQAWRDAYDKIEVLEEKVFELRQAFFREDDGFYRDGEIKPAWDRAIDQLEGAHREAEARQEELAVFLEGGREAGALPGWLREGIDLEPQPRALEETGAEPGEPVIYSQEATDPP